MSFTAFPVLASILQNAKLLRDPLGSLAISCAAINDVAAWCVACVQQVPP
jgi:Kef-type K+ transport system membrane component KefB